MSMNNNFRIIIIDDNPAIHHDFIKILATSASATPVLDILSVKLFGKKEESIHLPQFEIDTAFQGQEGVSRIEEAKRQGKNYSLAFVDVRMPPGWDGVETIKHIWEVDKDIQVVICTAYSDYSWEETIAHLGQTDNLLILKKPFDNVSVRQLACALTRKWQLFQDARHYTDMLKKQVADRTLSLQESVSLLKSTFESSSDGILVINNNGDLIHYNQKFVEMFRVPEDILTHKKEDTLFLFIKNQLLDPEQFLKKIAELHQKKEDISIDMVKLRNGSILECYSQPHKLNHETIGRILDFRDITKRAKLEQELQHQATHDSLTGSANRVLLLRRIYDVAIEAEKNHTMFAILFFDLDRFKLVNDSLSHAAGDELLIEASCRLKSLMDPKDTLARLGGDEFVIVLADIEQIDRVNHKINQILEAFRRPFKIHQRDVITTVSIGVSIYPEHGKTAEELLRHADSAMYHVKARKGNHFQYYTSDIQDEMQNSLDQELQLRLAIENKEFFLVYQPQIGLHEEKLVAVEALVRWRHPTKGILLPIDFIPLAEDMGLISVIGEWVMRAACMQNKAWQDLGLSPIRMAVNVTSQQFKENNLVEIVRKILLDTQLEPKYLELELTESVILNSYHTIKTVAELKELGVGIAVDDFGTGYSSLNYLQKMPLDRLKIDRSFIQHIQTNRDDEVIIRAVISMAKNLNLEVLAEGVETQEQLNFLKKNHCGDVQGFYFSKPLTVFELEKYLRNPKNIKDIQAMIRDKK